MTTVNVETSPFAMFPAQGDYSNTDTERRHALGVLAAHADTTDALREVALMLELIDPPTEAEPTPVYCLNGHDQTTHGKVRRDGIPYCHQCVGAYIPDSDTADATGSVRRIRHLLLNGFTMRTLGRMLGMSAPSVSRIATGARARLPKVMAATIREVFDANRDEFHDTPLQPATVEARKDWVWAELFEDIDDPQCEPVIPKRVAA